MEENRTSETSNEVQQPVEPESERPKLPSFGGRLMAIFAEPKVVFDYVARRNDFWLPFIILSILMAVANLLSLPANIAGQELIAGVTGRPAPSMNATTYIVSIIQAPIQLIIALLIMAVIIWVVILFTTGSAGYGKAMSVAAWSYFPSALGLLLNGIVVSVVRPEIQSLASMMADQMPVIHYTSLNALFGGAGAVLSMVLMTVSIFYIWQLWLLFIGARRSFAASPTGASVLVIVFLLLQLGFAALIGWSMSMLQNL